MRLSGNGFSILSFKLRPKKPLMLDFSNLDLYSTSDNFTRLILPTRIIYKRLKSESKYLGNNLELLSISPDTLYLEIKNSKINEK